MAATKTTFRTTLEGNGKSATGVCVPDDVVASLGSSRRPPVKVTINGHTYRSTIAVMAGRFMVGVSAENRAKAAVAAGDEVDVTLELDDAPREIAVPADFANALGRVPAAKAFFDGLSYSQRRWFVDGIESAKKAETRERRVAQAVERLASGRGQR